MRIQSSFEGLLRIVLLLICPFVAWRSVRLARADWLFGMGTLEAADRAIQMEPSDGAMIALASEYRSNQGEMTPDVDRALERAARLNPLDSSIPMTLGIRAEFRGDVPAAERYLVHAAEIDHQFKPAWTLANFYFRTNRPEKMQPLIQRCLNLDPLGFDPEPVFELSWNLTNDSKKILSRMPRPRLLQYLSWLVKTRKVDAALEAWPEALAVMDPTQPGDADTLKTFMDFLASAGRIDGAVRAWNQLVDRGVVHSGRLNPAAGISIADPAFAWPHSRNTFDWILDGAKGVFFSAVAPSLRVELDGNEPESFRVLTALAPVIPEKKYRLIWKADSSRLSAPRDPGLSFRLLREPGQALAQCHPLLETDGSGSCTFENPAGQDDIRIDLMYTRAPGTTRIQGSLRLERVALEFGS